MPKNIYVSFGDSRNDPTYSDVDGCMLVESKDDASMFNPCVRGVVRKAPIIPKNEEELKVLATILGWSVGKDNDGQMILYTGIQADPSKPKPKRKNCWRKKSEYLP